MPPVIQSIAACPSTTTSNVVPYASNTLVPVHSTTAINPCISNTLNNQTKLSHNTHLYINNTVVPNANNSCLLSQTVVNANRNSALLAFTNQNSGSVATSSCLHSPNEPSHGIISENGIAAAHTPPLQDVKYECHDLRLVY